MAEEEGRDLLKDNLEDSDLDMAKTQREMQINELREKLRIMEESNQALMAQNKRLTRKLETANTYAEDLRLQVEKLSLRLEGSGNDGEVIHKSCQTYESYYHDAKEALPVKGSEIVEDVVKAAEEMAHKQFLEDMVYEETSGLYYHYKTGYYYDAQRRLYYDGNSGTYYKYNYESNEYEVHSQVAVDADKGEKLRKKHKKSRKKQRTSDKDTKPTDLDDPKGQSLPVTASDETADNKEEGEVDDAEEEGEINETSGSSDDSSEQDEQEEQDVHLQNNQIMHCPEPCLRLIVTTSESVRIGSLFIVTCLGGSVGRLGDHEVQVDDVGCSKHHADITFEECKYFVTDAGSRNGTFVNDKAVSRKTEIGHGSVLQIGNTVLTCHVHPGRETCFECEPGLTMKPEQQNAVTYNRDSSRKAEMKQLRRKYGLERKDEGHSTVPEEASDQVAYVDRAKIRRRDVGSSHHKEKTESSHVNQHISSKNKGFRMLSKMGWRQGDGLGKGESGRVEPVQVDVRTERAGLGAENASLPPVDLKTKAKMEMWKKTRERGPV